eukprot:SAG11_NODE_1144_length_5695_cov_2.181558_4_plen_575_part_00
MIFLDQQCNFAANRPSESVIGRTLAIHTHYGSGAWSCAPISMATPDQALSAPPQCEATATGVAHMDTARFTVAWTDAEGVRCPDRAAQVCETLIFYLFNAILVRLQVEQQGTFVLELYPQRAEKTVKNFKETVAGGHYNGVLFHRVIEDFIIQGGDFSCTAEDDSNCGAGGHAVVWSGFCKGAAGEPGVPSTAESCAYENWTLPDELEGGVKHWPYVASMTTVANQANTAGSQFFILARESEFNGLPGASDLDGGFNAFGQVIEGFEILDALNAVAVSGSTPLQNAVILNATMHYHPSTGRRRAAERATATASLAGSDGAQQAHALAPFAIAVTLLVNIYAGGHVSGAHYNPAVTFAVYWRGKIDAALALLYVMAQLCGTVAGTLIGFVLLDEDAAYPQVAPGISFGRAFMAELVVTFALCLTVLHVTTTQAQQNNSYYGMAISFVVLSGAVSVGRISGGVFNPAVGSMVALHGEFDDLFLYWLAPLVAASLAVVAFRATEPVQPILVESDASAEEIAGLPNGWRRLKSDSGETYYQNDMQKLTQWDRPEGPNTVESFTGDRQTFSQVRTAREA